MNILGRIFAMVIVAVPMMFGVPSASAADQSDEAYAARENGDYVIAMRPWRPLAERGDAKAQYGVGFLYSNGLGVPLDFAKAQMLARDWTANSGSTAIVRAEGVDRSKNESLAGEWLAVFTPVASRSSWHQLSACRVQLNARPCAKTFKIEQLIRIQLNPIERVLL